MNAPGTFYFSEQFHSVRPDIARRVVSYHYDHEVWTSLFEFAGLDSMLLAKRDTGQVREAYRFPPRARRDRPCWNRPLQGPESEAPGARNGASLRPMSLASAGVKTGGAHFLAAERAGAVLGQHISEQWSRNSGMRIAQSM